MDNAWKRIVFILLPDERHGFDIDSPPALHCHPQPVKREAIAEKVPCWTSLEGRQDEHENKVDSSPRKGAGGRFLGLKRTKNKSKGPANGLAQRQRLTLSPLSRNLAQRWAYHQRRSRCPLEPVLASPQPEEAFLGWRICLWNCLLDFLTKLLRNQAFSHPNISSNTFLCVPHVSDDP